MKSLSEYIKESSSLFHDVITPYEFDLKKSLENSEFFIRVRKYEGEKLVLNDDYLETDNIKEFRSALIKLKNFKLFSVTDTDKYKMSAHWCSAEEPRDVIYLTLYVSGQYNATQTLVIDLEFNNIYEVDPFKDIKWPRRGNSDKLVTFTPSVLWKGKFI